MYLIHASWIPSEEKSFKSEGHFAVWVETSGVKGDHLSHLKKDELIDFFAKKLGLIKERNAQYNKKAYYFLFPAVKQKPLRSLKMLSYTNITIPENYNYNYWKIDCIVPEQITSFLKELYFMSLYFPPDIQLGNDILFWYRCYQGFKEIILKDQYIPAIKHHAETKKTKKQKGNKSEEFYSGWEIVSHNYEERIEQLSKQMPKICGAGFITIPKEKQYFAGKTLLQNFNENLLEQLINAINFTGKIHKDMEDTFISGCIKNYLNWSRQEWLETWQHWYAWREQLITTHSEAEFYLVFRLTEAKPKKPDIWLIDLLVESKQDPSFKIPLQEYWRCKDRKKYQAFLGQGFENNLLLQLGSASRIYNNLERGLNTTHPTEFSLTLSEAYSFLREEAWVLQNAGYKVVIPSWWTPKGSQKAKIRLKSRDKKADNSGRGFFQPEELINFNYELSIGEETITEQEWQMLVDAKTPLVQFRGQWMELNKEKMEAMLEFWRNNKNLTQMSLVELMKKTITDEENFTFDKQLTNMMEHLWDKSKFQELKAPVTFNGKLRNYQQRGFSWLYYLEQIGMNPCLADDMGLGKTIQVLALLLHEKADKKTKTLLIAPTSVLGNWQKETERFAPDLKAIIFHGPGRSKTEEAFAKFAKDQDIVITSYSLARKDEKLLQKTKWHRIVIDEAQNIKNPKAAQTRAINKIEANNRIALTGTPIENRLLDLWSIFNFLNPGYLGNHTNFKKVFEIPVQKNNDTNISAKLKKLVEPFILRRTKTDKTIIQDLPDKIEQKVYCNLTKEQGSLYQAVVQDVAEKINESEGIERKGLILSTLTRLKQICNHPAQFLQDDSLFSEERSHKLQRLTEMIEEVIAEQESLLIFTQFTEIGAALARLLKTKHYNTYYLHGGTTRKHREQMISEFQDSQTEASIFILSLKAGGVGITLTKANHVFHFDRWWNPAVENQATDRAYRIGQEKKVFAHKFVTIGTLEERIDTMLEHKQKMADSIIGTGESWLTELDNEAFRELIQLSKTAIME